MNSARYSLSTLAAILLAQSLWAATATIQIDASKPGPKIDPKMYGIFLEEINHGVDGGLYAELLRNRAFEDAKPPEGFTFRNGRWLDAKGYDAGFHHSTNSLPYWSLIVEGSAKGSMYLDMENPLNVISPRSLRLEIEDATSGRLGIANEGFWGIGVMPGEKYNLSFWARCSDGYTGKLSAILEDENGTACSEAVKATGLTTQWKRYQMTLAGTKNEAKARFVLSANGKGKVWFDFVSLFPAKTWNNRPNGFRSDLAQMIADLKPGFVRFPGGCVVEGGTIETAYNWKYTIGPIEERQEQWGAWSYRRTHGMGFLEYLQFCEDLGAEPLHVEFAGQTCLFRESENVPMPDMGWVATNFLDAIEYANGGENTDWGKLRASQGHPKPFNLKMVEIGNENGTLEFPPRYQFVYKLLKAKYPEIKYIADLSWINREMMRGCAFDIEDNHYYNGPSWFIANQNMYGNRDRKLPPVYLGEIAVTSDEGGPDKGNLISALSEGVYLMGAERNSDVIKMVSYAPLLAHVKGRSGWHGMIYFDSQRSFGTVSYYLWKLFGLNRPDATVKTEVEVSISKPPAISGAIGVGTWNTSAEFKDIRIEKEGQLLSSVDFSKGAEGWKTEDGKWSVLDGAYRQSDNAVGLSFFGDDNWSNYTLTLKARKLAGDEGFLIAFGHKGEDKTWWNIGGWGNHEHAIEFKRNQLGRRVPGTIEINRWYDVKVELNDRRIRCYLDGKLIHDETASDTKAFHAMAGRNESNGEIILKAINIGSEPITTTLDIQGVSALEPQATLSVIHSDRLQDNNSLDQPTQIVPVEKTISIPDKKFTHEFPPYSFTLLKLKSKGGFAATSQESKTVDSQASEPDASAANVALVAKPSTSYVSGHETISGLNSGHNPENSNDKSHGAYGNWPRNGTQWVQYEWSQPISTRQIQVYWFDDHGGVRLPKECRFKYWDGSAFADVKDFSGVGLLENKYNNATFAEITTSKLCLEFDSDGSSSTGILQWRVLDSGKSPNFPPSVTAGEDRVAVGTSKTHLLGTVKDDGKITSTPLVAWTKVSGPGTVTFENPNQLETAASFSALGEYVLSLKADDGQLTASDTLKVKVEAPFATTHLDPVITKTYKINSPLWNSRIKNLIVHWIPHCYNKMSDPTVAEGGIENFTEAGKKLAGKEHKSQQGAVFANAWVHNTVEAMCVALMVDPQNDSEIVEAQKAIREKLEDWIPKILSAQEPDGYLHTSYTLEGHPRWTNKDDHEGYQAGYFIESAIAHYVMTGKKDSRMVDAARKLADCWYNNIGPAPKKTWYDGHQELEQALVRFARFIDENEGAGKGGKYVELARFLFDSRKNGSEYDQSHLPVTRQYEAVGHAVRAVYSYSGMTDIAIETGDLNYQSAVKSIWNNLINKKYYVTGGVGSGETSEGFGKNYSLPNHAYCESCSSCGELFFQYKMNLGTHESKYADLYEETLYNAILSDIDFEGNNFTYTNPLDASEERYGWHGCPCCVGNIPRTLLMLPTWTYAKSSDGLYVNLFIGSTMTVENVAGTDVELVQKTDYPWKGTVSITVNPSASKSFSIRIRVPNRQTSPLYTGTPACNGLVSLGVNGTAISPVIENGYAVITREWKKGDTLSFELPMVIQRVTADPNIKADLGRVAMRYGPLIYNIESVDQDLEQTLNSDSTLSTEWNGDLLGGILQIKGTFANGARLTAIPNYVRNNRGGRSLVWIKSDQK